MWPVTAKGSRVRTGTPSGGDGGDGAGEGPGTSPWGLPGRPRGLGALGGRWEGCAALGGGLVFASRFLKTAILNREKKFKTRTLGRMWRAGLCIWVGGSMKGEEQRAARAARGGVSDRSASPPPWGTQGAAAALWLPAGGWCDRGSASFGRESIFKIGHSKSRKKVQNPDPRSYVARESLHLARWVYEGSRAALAAARPTALGEDVRVTPGRLSRRSESCHHSIHTAPLLRSSLRSAGGSAASGACLTRSTRRPRPEGGEGGYNRGRGRRPRPRRLGFVGDWALPTTIS